MPKKPHWQEKVKDVNGWLEEFQGESDRAAAVLAVAYLDAQLEQLLRGFLVDAQDTGALFSPDAPLGSFSARRRMAFALGMLTRQQNRDIELMGRVRNRFAHHLHGLSFSDNEVAQLCEQQKVLTMLNQQCNARSKFVTAAALLSMDLAMRALRISERRCILPKEGKEAAKGDA